MDRTNVPLTKDDRDPAIVKDTGRSVKESPGKDGPWLGGAAVEEMPVSAPAEVSDERRLNVKFTPEAYAQLQDMAKRRGKTLSETVREALGFDLWLEEQLAQGYSLQLRRKDGATMMVAIPRR